MTLSLLWHGMWMDGVVHFGSLNFPPSLMLVCMFCFLLTSLGVMAFWYPNRWVVTTIKAGGCSDACFLSLSGFCFGG